MSPVYTKQDANTAIKIYDFITAACKNTNPPLSYATLLKTKALNDAMLWDGGEKSHASFKMSLFWSWRCKNNLTGRSFHYCSAVFKQIEQLLNEPSAENVCSSAVSTSVSKFTNDFKPRFWWSCAERVANIRRHSSPFLTLDSDQSVSWQPGLSCHYKSVHNWTERVSLCCVLLQPVYSVLSA